MMTVGAVFFEGDKPDWAKIAIIAKKLRELN